MTAQELVDNRVDLTTAHEVISDASVQLLTLDQTPIAVGRQAVAAQTRELLMLSDRLQLAASLVRNEYWHARGAESYGL